MKFTPRKAPGSRELLDFRVGIRAGACPHCQCRGTLIAHGYIHGNAATGCVTASRAQRFFAPTGTLN